jgi:hypothetical protein
MLTIGDMRRDFIVRRKGALSLPITGVIVYSTAAILSLILDPRWHNLALTLCFWCIMPIGATVMKIRGEEQGSPEQNALYDLSTKARWMALSTWAIHIPIWIYAFGWNRLCSPLGHFLMDIGASGRLLSPCNADRVRFGRVASGPG